jgi:sigma-B regulation protein RsbU (phosphoserine phosphatase)
VRQALVRRFVQPLPIQSQSTRLFFLDYALFVISGLGVGLFNTLAFGFPFVGSGLKIAVGFAAIGLIPALDLSLEWEYRIIRQAHGGRQVSVVDGSYYPQTRKFTLLASSAIIFLTFALSLILSRDIFWLMGQSQNSESLSYLLNVMIREVIFVMGTFLGLTLVAVFSYARNLRLLFANQTSVLELVSQGRLGTKVPVVTNDEFAVIAGHTNVMIDRLLERERMSQGLGLASQIQANLLPKASPLLPGVQVFGSSLFCDETGGDFYDFLVRETEDGPELVMVVGDVTGHGVGSALLMTSLRAYMKAHLHHVADLADVMDATNAMICRDVAGSGNFITAFLFSYNPSTRRAKWVGAGHNPAVFQAFGANQPRELVGQDIPLGVDARWSYNLLSDQLAPGILLLGTDGIWEAMNVDTLMFGKDRLYQVLEKSLHASPQQITSRIFEKIEEFTGAAEVEDDRTVVIARFG